MSIENIVGVGLGVALLLPITGCKGGEKPATVAVTGTVTYKGDPLAGADVSFIAKQEGGRAASGTTDSQGHFKLQTYMGGNNMIAGAIPGDYSITVRKRENTTEQLRATMAGGAGPDGAKMLEAGANRQGPPVGGGPPGGGPPGGGPPPGMMRGIAMEGKSLIPQRYENPASSGLTATVKPSGNEPVKIELVD